MRSERVWFFKQVAIGVVALLFVAQAGSLVAREWMNARLSSSSQLAVNALQAGVKQLSTSADVSSYAVIASSLREAKNELQTRNTVTAQIGSIAHMFESASFYRPDPVHASVRSDAAVVVAADTFSWLASATPAIARIAGYDAVQDVAVAYDDRDLLGRLYAARIGMTGAVERLASPPATVPSADVHALVVVVRDSIDAAGAAIRAIDSGTSPDAHIRRYVTSATRASHTASELAELLSGEPFRASLSALLQ